MVLVVLPCLVCRIEGIFDSIDVASKGEGKGGGEGGGG